MASWRAPQVQVMDWPGCRGALLSSSLQRVTNHRNNISLLLAIETIRLITQGAQQAPLAFGAQLVHHDPLLALLLFRTQPKTNTSDRLPLCTAGKP